MPNIEDIGESLFIKHKKYFEKVLFTKHKKYFEIMVRWIFKLTDVTHTYKSVYSEILDFYSDPVLGFKT